MGNDFKRGYISVALILLIAVSSSKVPKVANAISIIINHHPVVLCNGTINGDCINADDDDNEDQLVMDFEVSRRRLASGGSITYNLKQDKGFCDPKVYSSCIGPDAKLYKRPCNSMNLCERPPSH